jgi:hypothetical protein
MKLILFSFFALYITFCQAYGNEKYITNPPKGWEHISDPEQLPRKIKEIYLGKANATNRFTPSINVAYEETALPSEEYIKLAITYHEAQGETICKRLGKIDTKAGPADLLQIDRSSQWGAIRFVQAIIIRNGEAYVVTSTCLKEDFSNLSSQIFKALQSFNK